MHKPVSSERKEFALLYNRKYAHKQRGLSETRCKWCGRYLPVGLTDYHESCLEQKLKIK